MSKDVTQKVSNHIGGKDLITVGIYTVIYIVIIGIFGALLSTPVKKYTLTAGDPTA